MRKIFYFIATAAFSLTMFACEKQQNTQERVLSTDTTEVEVEQKVQETQVDTTTKTETIDKEQNQQKN
ncbi:MAG: hypothetical protein ACK40G_04335 [Cytophagaceae bacterium]